MILRFEKIVDLEFEIDSKYYQISFFIEVFIRLEQLFLIKTKFIESSILKVLLQIFSNLSRC